MTATEDLFLPAPVETHFRRVQRMAPQHQSPPLLRGHPVFHQGQVQVFVAAVELVADHRMPVVREVDADLMFAPGQRLHAQQSKIALRPHETALHLELRLCRRAVGPDAIFDRDFARFVPAERFVNQSIGHADMSLDDGEIFFLHGASFPDFSQRLRRRVGFGHQYNAAGFAVEAVDQVRPRVRRQMQPDPADQTGIGVAFRGMAHQVRRFVDDQQFGVFVDNLK